MRFAACTLQFCIGSMRERGAADISDTVAFDWRRWLVNLSQGRDLVGLGWCESSHVAGRRPTHPSSQSAASMAPTPRWILTARPTQPAEAGTVALCKRQTIHGRRYPCSRRRPGSTRVGCSYASSGSRTCEPARQRAALNSLPCALQLAPYSFVARLKNELFILIFIPILNSILILILMIEILKR